jgi:hypothetical protein
VITLKDDSIRTIIAVVITLFAGWRTRVNWRAFNAAKGKPLLDNVTTERLAEIPPEWTLKPTRWPPPVDHDFQPTLEKRVLLAYAAIARRASRTASIAAECLLVIGSAWLGLQLEGIWRSYGSYLESIASNTNDPPYTLHVLSFFSISQIGSFVTIVLGFAFSILGKSYADAEEAYRFAATIDNTASQPPTTPHPRGVSLWSRVKALFV